MSELRHRTTRSNSKKKENGSSDVTPNIDAEDVTKLVRPNSLVLPLVALTLLIPRVVASLYMPIMDCDETYNYWEPTHLLLYGYGLQTWEYSPVYALRSYAYVALHSAVGYILSMVLSNKVAVFYGIRMLLALLSTICDTAFVHAIYTTYNSTSLAYTTAVFLAVATGMHHASISYLPSSFAMYTITLAMAAWMQHKYNRVVLYVGISVLFGWPFVALLAVLPAVDILINHVRQLPALIMTGAATVALVLIPSVLIDYVAYGKIVLPVLNIALYNAATTHGANLYGTEPVTFYLYNLALNFNLAFILALFALPIAFVNSISRSVHQRQAHISAMKLSGSMYVWLIAMSSMAHKEERFIYVVYPLICFSAAYTMQYAYKILVLIVNTVLSTKLRTVQPLNTLVTVLILAAFTLLSASRTTALIKSYNAPLGVYQYVYNLPTPVQQGRTTKVCVGKEWYRFPSHYLLNNDQRLRYIKSDFNGLLPKHYTVSQRNNATHVERVLHATRAVPSGMNDQNRAVADRYIEAWQCDYMIDTQYKRSILTDNHWSTWVKVRKNEQTRCTDIHSFERVYGETFLDATVSLQLHRVLYIPGQYEQQNVFGEYAVYQHKIKNHCDPNVEIY